MRALCLITSVIPREKSVVEQNGRLSPDIPEQAIRERVRLRVAAMDTSVAAICRENAIPGSQVNNWLSNLPGMTLRSWFRLASMLHVTPAWLLDGDPVEALGTDRPSADLEDVVGDQVGGF